MIQKDKKNDIEVSFFFLYEKVVGNMENNR